MPMREDPSISHGRRSKMIIHELIHSFFDLLITARKVRDQGESHFVFLKRWPNDPTNAAMNAVCTDKEPGLIRCRRGNNFDTVFFFLDIYDLFSREETSPAFNSLIRKQGIEICAAHEYGYSALFMCFHCPVAVMDAGTEAFTFNNAFRK